MIYGIVVFNSVEGRASSKSIIIA